MTINVFMKVRDYRLKYHDWVRRKNNVLFIQRVNKLASFRFGLYGDIWEHNIAKIISENN